MKILNNNLTVSSITATNYYGLPSYSTGMFMFTSSVSDIAGKYDAKILTSYTASTLTTSATTVGTSETLMGEFITSSGQPGTTVLPAGKIQVHIETQKASGPQNYIVRAKIYKRSSGGVETLLSTTDDSSSSAVNSVLQHNLTATLSSNQYILTTDRIVIKFFGQVSSSSYSIDLRWDDATESRMELPLSFGGGGGSGTSGTSGAAGTSGTSGINGTSGTSGINGTSGTSGINGTSGTSGATGASGTSGTSGTSSAGGGLSYVDYPTFTNQTSSITDSGWRACVDLANYSIGTEAVGSNVLYLCYVQIPNGKTISSFRFRVSATGTTTNIGLYSCSLYSNGENSYIYPSTLRSTLSSSLSVSSTGTKTITGLSYTIDSSLTTNNLWCFAFTSDNAALQLAAWSGAGTAVLPAGRGIYETGGTAYRVFGHKLTMASSSLPSSLAFNASYSISTNPTYMFYRAN